jgi:hypothetical protein
MKEVIIKFLILSTAVQSVTLLTRPKRPADEFMRIFFVFFPTARGGGV